MPDDRVSQLVATIADGVTATAEQICGLSEDEIGEIERSQPAPVAAAYRRFLQLAGGGAGRFLQGSDIFYPIVLEVGPWAQALLKDNEVQFALTDADRVFYMHQGYEFHFLRGDAADPEVWAYNEVSIQVPTLRFPRFTDWLDFEIRVRTAAWRRLLGGQQEPCRHDDGHPDGGV